VLPFWLIFAWIQTSEFFEPYIGASMWWESHSYVIQLFASVAVAAVAPGVGAMLQYRNLTIGRSGRSGGMSIKFR